MSIKIGHFFFLTFCCIITPISGSIDHYCIMENSEKWKKNKEKIRTIYPKSHEKFKNSKFRGQFYWFLLKKESTEIPERHAFEENPLRVE